MLLAVYLFLAGSGLLFLLLSFMRDEQRLVLTAAAMVTFFSVAIASGSVDMPWCEYSTGWQCTVQSVSETGAMIFFLMLGLLSLVWLLADVFGYGVKKADKVG